MAGNTNPLVVWQWNCASVKRRRATLQQFVASQAVKPHVIILQETLDDALTFPGYLSCRLGARGGEAWFGNLGRKKMLI